MEVVTVFLFLCVMVKVVAIINATRWLGTYGTQYREFLDQLEGTLGSLRPQDFDGARTSYHAGFFPFGLKDVRLREAIHRLRGGLRLRRIAGSVLGLYFRFLVQYHYLALLTTLYLVLLPGIHIVLTGDAPTTFHAGLAYFLALLLLVMNIAIQVESFLGYALLGSYGRYFHMLTPRSVRIAAGSPFLVEIAVAAVLSLVMLITGAGACFVTYTLFDGFRGDGLLEYNVVNPLNWGAIYLQCVYFTLTTLTTVGYGDIGPRNGFGQLTASLLLVQNFFFLVILVSTIFSAIKAIPPSIPRKPQA